jgi:hypothetical protein
MSRADALDTYNLRGYSHGIAIPVVKLVEEIPGWAGTRRGSVGPQTFSSGDHRSEGHSGARVAQAAAQWLFPCRARTCERIHGAGQQSSVPKNEPWDVILAKWPRFLKLLLSSTQNMM